MQIIDEVIECEGRSDRVEIYPMGDFHIGKRNCCETAIKKQAAEILRRSELPNRHVRVILGGDQTNAITPADLRRFDFAELADWFIDSDADETRERLSDIVGQEIKHAAELLKPIAPFIIGAIYGNHEGQMRKQHHTNTHKALCEQLGIKDLTNEACIRIVCRRRTGKGKQTSGSTINIYIRHGYGSGRTPGAEPNKLQRMLDEWEWADICFSGHTHTYCVLPPKPVLYVPRMGRRILAQRYRFAANWGCWLYSHMVGAGSYESDACYPAKPMMTVKAVIWPFWRATINGSAVEAPKIELREYPIL